MKILSIGKYSKCIVECTESELRTLSGLDERSFNEGQEIDIYKDYQQIQYIQEHKKNLIKQSDWLIEQGQKLKKAAESFPNKIITSDAQVKP